MAAVDLLLACRPSWFHLGRRLGSEVLGRALISDDNSVADQSYDLALLADSDSIKVREEPIGTSLPVFCPERHINEDGTFCVGIEAGERIASLEDAETWWARLHRYLICQDVAQRVRYWPPDIGYDHGQAGYYHREALAAATELGIREQYIADHAANRTQWIRRMRRDDRKLGPVLLNVRSPCPIGCKDNRGHRLLRRNCCRRDALSRLVDNESKRYAYLQALWKHLIRAGKPCCGTIQSCPLRVGIAD